MVRCLTMEPMVLILIFKVLHLWISFVLQAVVVALERSLLLGEMGSQEVQAVVQQENFKASRGNLSSIKCADVWSHRQELLVWQRALRHACCAARFAWQS